MKTNSDYRIRGSFPRFSTRPHVRGYARPGDVDLEVRFTAPAPDDQDPCPSEAQPAMSCGLCGKPVEDQAPGPGLFVALTAQRVCGRCAKRHAPQLADMIAGYRSKTARERGDVQGTAKATTGGKMTLVIAAPDEERSTSRDILEDTHFDWKCIEETQPGMDWGTAFIPADVSRSDALLLLAAIRYILQMPAA